MLVIFKVALFSVRNLYGYQRSVSLTKYSCNGRRKLLISWWAWTEVALKVERLTDCSPTTREFANRLKWLRVLYSDTFDLIIAERPFNLKEGFFYHFNALYKIFSKHTSHSMWSLFGDPQYRVSTSQVL